MQAAWHKQYLGFLKRLLQYVLHVLVNAVQLVLLDVAFLQQLGPVLLVAVLMLLDGLQPEAETLDQPSAPAFVSTRTAALPSFSSRPWGWL